ncbi:HNH endonuclease family protein [Streptomyces sp. LX-29]|uniref:HNH endonuclease family protein n=1 Tax=Streptomyces sp. LX-29 TaxID=2900152 RepID=UPI00240D7E9A|nr:HNH endonuclease family protein [Streptomyces sp. LX-29]WFB06212.1 HNH endonuclease family protein [Streptomyces sp. LX-29]
MGLERTIATWAAVATAGTGLALSAVPAWAAPGATVTTTLREAIAALSVADEDRTGYTRDAFRHWVDADRDGCNTRNEVLIEEATVAPAVGGRCVLTGGEWHSYYDDVDQTNASGLDIDHMVPLAEAWDSGASAWSAQERQEYANDLGDPRSLVAVTASENRKKADQDPDEWLPPDDEALCRYVTEWTVVKTRWRLAVDDGEAAALQRLGAGCPDASITVVLAR